MKTKYIIALCLFCLVAGFFSGRQTISEKEVIRYVQGEKQSGKVEIPKPIEALPDKPILPIKPDTITINNVEYITQIVDTAAIIADYITNRIYRFDVFDKPDIGKLSVDATVQYNKIFDFKYSFLPITKEIIRTTKVVWMPFVAGSYNSFDQISIGGGIFYHDLGFEAKYIRNLHMQEDGYEIGIKYKF